MDVNAYKYEQSSVEEWMFPQSTDNLHISRQWNKHVNCSPVLEEV